MMEVTQFEIDSEDEDEDETDESEKRLDEMIVARMLSGASAQRTSKAHEIYSTTVASAGGVVKGSTMALTLTDKKCKSPTMSTLETTMTSFSRPTSREQTSDFVSNDWQLISGASSSRGPINWPER